MGRYARVDRSGRPASARRGTVGPASANPRRVDGGPGGGMRPLAAHPAISAPSIVFGRFSPDPPSSPERILPGLIGGMPISMTRHHGGLPHRDPSRWGRKRTGRRGDDLPAARRKVDRTPSGQARSCAGKRRSAPSSPRVISPGSACRSSRRSAPASSLRPSRSRSRRTCRSTSHPPGSDAIR